MHNAPNERWGDCGLLCQKQLWDQKACEMWNHESVTNTNFESSRFTALTTMSYILHAALFITLSSVPQTYSSHGRWASSYFPELPAEPVTWFLRLEGRRPVWLHTFPFAWGKADWKTCTYLYMTMTVKYQMLHLRLKKWIQFENTIL